MPQRNAPSMDGVNMCRTHPSSPILPQGLTFSRLAPRRGKKQAKRNLPQLMTAARHQLRRAMPASVPFCLPASYFPSAPEKDLVNPARINPCRRITPPFFPDLGANGFWVNPPLWVGRKEIWLSVWLCVCNSNLGGKHRGVGEACARLLMPHWWTSLGYSQRGTED